ncbi:hypothetical protein F4678DRAFT_457384 [Xylaria arbuscula]|nr:hypothetical protein F4678DRAFT_457384 [Xylaria arbuscula]
MVHNLSDFSVNSLISTPERYEDEVQPRIVSDIRSHRPWIVQVEVLEERAAAMSTNSRVVLPPAPSRPLATNPERVRRIMSVRNLLEAVQNPEEKAADTPDDIGTTVSRPSLQDSLLNPQCIPYWPQAPPQSLQVEDHQYVAASYASLSDHPKSLRGRQFDDQLNSHARIVSLPIWDDLGHENVECEPNESRWLFAEFDIEQDALYDVERKPATTTRTTTILGDKGPGEHIVAA